MRSHLLLLALLSFSLFLFAACGEDSSTNSDYYGGENTSSNNPSNNTTSANNSSPWGANNTSAEAPQDWDEDGVADQPVPGEEDPTNEGDKFEEVGTNPFVMTGHDPFSTFAIDVDTASYDIFRRDMNNGYLPQPSSVRLEEYINYFSYDYETPIVDGELPFSINLAAAPTMFDAETTLLRVGIQGKVVPPEEKKPANIVFLIDTSGSMSSSVKLPLVKALLNETLAVLDPTDTVSIVTYAGGTGVRLSATPVSELETIRDVINSLSAGGSTAGASGINLAYEQAESAFIEGGINHVILCSDGDFNVGISSTDDLISLIEVKRETGITLTVIGFGTGNLNDEMMEGISNAGDGVYAVISDADQAIRYANERMLSTLIHIAKDVKIQVEFNPLFVTAYRLLGYENRAIADEDFRNDAVDAGEIGSGHQVTALYELVLVGDDLPNMEGAPPIEDGEAVTGERDVAEQELVRVKVRYKQPGASIEDPATEVAKGLIPTDILASSFDAGDSFRWAIALAGYAEILKNSPYAAEARLPEIEAIIEGLAGLEDPDRAEFYQLFLQSLPLIEAR